MIPKFLEGKTPFIIAEVGSNWSTLGDCLYSIRSAKSCGADAVKFQLYDRKALYGIPDFIDSQGLVYEGNPVIQLGTLRPEWLPQLKAEADHSGIEFMCSAFSPELYDVVDPYVNIHKVASSEMCHVRILEKLRAIGKPVILSTGAQHVNDIKLAVSILGNTPTVLMYCVAAYPANEVNLDCIKVLGDIFGLMVGYSDHTTDALLIPKLSIDRGACVLEKHFNAVEAKGPDSGHSLDPRSFKLMVDTIRGKAGNPTVMPSFSETPMLLRHKRRLIATRDIKVGDKFVEGENFGIYRSLKDETHAFGPFMVNEVNGKTALKEIAAGDGVGSGDC